MEEKIVNGVLCFSKDSDLQGGETEWVPYTLESMTTAFMALKSIYESTNRRANKLDRIIKGISELIEGVKIACC